MTFHPYITNDQADYADGIAPNVLAFLETQGITFTPDGVDVASPAALHDALQLAAQVHDTFDNDDDTAWHWLNLGGDDDLDYGGSYVQEALEPIAEELGVTFDDDYDTTDLHARLRAWGIAQGHHTMA